MEISTYDLIGLSYRKLIQKLVGRTDVNGNVRSKEALVYFRSGVTESDINMGRFKLSDFKPGKFTYCKVCRVCIVSPASNRHLQAFYHKHNLYERIQEFLRAST